MDREHSAERNRRSPFTVSVRVESEADAEHNDAEGRDALDIVNMLSLCEGTCIVLDCMEFVDFHVEDARDVVVM